MNLTLASKYVGHSFGALSLTLEMPFKDNADLPDEEVGWDGKRSKRLGAAALEAMLAVLPDLRAEPASEPGHTMSRGTAD